MMSESLILEDIEKDVVRETKRFKPLSIVRFGSSLSGMKFAGDVDFLLISKGGGRKDDIYDIVGRISTKFGIHVSIIPMNIRDFVKKAKRGDEFVLNAMAGRLIHGKKPEDIVWQGK